MKAVSATYTQRRTLGQYEHEEISITMAPDAEEAISADILLAEARRAVVRTTTAYLNAARLRAQKDKDDAARAAAKNTDEGK